MTLDRTPRGPSSTAITALKASTPALAADTCAWRGDPGASGVNRSSEDKHI